GLPGFGDVIVFPSREQLQMSFLHHPNGIHLYCAPLRSAASNALNHSLYTLFRSSLASLLDTIGGSTYFNEARASTIFSICEWEWAVNTVPQGME
ncbi:hypothetical protein KI387_001968, partial [Taxus chinensis]